MADLQIIGRHALFFDDDASAKFVNSEAALVAWTADASLSIDRYDARHLLDRVPLRPKPGYVHKSDEELAEELVLDRERYLDLPTDDLPSNDTEVEIQAEGSYTAVPFSYGSTGEDQKPESDSKMEASNSVYRPPFPLPENLLNHLPPSEKVHQIISRTAKFVSKHGGQSEIVLRVKQGNNPTFGFLMPDHHLHPYFQFLIKNPNLDKTESNGGALSLLGSIYGSAEDDDEDDGVIIPSSNPNPNLKSIEDEKKNGDLQFEEKNSKPVLTKKNPSIVKVKETVKDVRMMEPDSAMINAMEKIAEFIMRNGRELEAVLIQQDKATNRFPFLVPSNAYHPYYLKVLEETKEGKRSEQSSRDPKSKPRNRESRSSTKNRESRSSTKNRSRESTPSEEPKKLEKLKMVLPKPSVTTKSEPTNQNTAPSLTTQEVSDIVQAATRGKTPLWSSQGPVSTQTQPASSSIDDAWISETIAKTAALVSSDVSLSLSKESKEEKVKAERLKKAKMLSSMIKSSIGGGPHLSDLLNKVTKVDSGDASKEVDKGEKVEREGSERDKSDRSKRDVKNYRKRDDSSDAEERESGERKKREKKRHFDEKRRRHRKHHGSLDEERERRERKRRERHSDEEEEDRYRKRRHKKRDHSDYSSDSEEDKHYKRSRKHAEKRKSSERRIEEEREQGQSTDVPDDLRAKVRAMLLQTL